MITSNSREVDNGSPTKDHREAHTSTDDNVKVGTKLLAPSSSVSTPWLRLKDPRIVRVSRAFGGKDRHSKVCTIRGLRDRRVRLSVPTAIQLYDLQDRLGLNQPSKVVDWLLNAAKSEIDELPPLPIHPGSFALAHHHQPMMVASSHHEVGSGSSSQLNREEFKLDKGVEWEELPRPIISMWNAKGKEAARDVPSNEKDNWMNRNHEENQEDGNSEGNRNNNNVHVSSSSFLSRGGDQSSSLVNNGGAYGTNSFFNLEAPNFTMSSHLGSHGFAASHHIEDPHGLNVMPLPSTLSLSSGSQVLVCPPGSTTQSYFPTSSMEIDPRQISHFQMVASSNQNLLPNPSPYSINQSMRPFHFSVTPRLHSEDEADKDHNFHAND